MTIRILLLNKSVEPTTSISQNGQQSQNFLAKKETIFSFRPNIKPEKIVISLTIDLFILDLYKNAKLSINLTTYFYQEDIIQIYDNKTQLLETGDINLKFSFIDQNLR